MARTLCCPPRGLEGPETDLPLLTGRLALALLAQLLACGSRGCTTGADARVPQHVLMVTPGVAGAEGWKELPYPTPGISQ